jgi:CheY-like chemotaxis protein
MDIQLPVMDGIEATKKIRSLEKSQKIGVFPSTPSSSASASASSTPVSTPMKQTPPSTPDLGLIPVIIVALTASSLPSDRTNALAAGCNDFLTKPVSLVWLERKIQEWGCMQALIDFDGWKRWKRDGEEALKEKRAEMTTIVSPGGSKSNFINSGGSNDKLFKSLKMKQRQKVEEKSENSDSAKSIITTTTSRSTLVTEKSSSNSLDSTKDNKINTLPSTTSTPPSGDIKDSPAGMVTSPPPIVIKPSTPQSPNTESSNICSISANMKNNLITNTSTSSITNTTNEPSSQPLTSLSTSDSQKTVRKRGNTVSSINGVNLSVGDQNGNSLM